MKRGKYDRIIGRLNLFFILLVISVMFIGLASSANWKGDPRSCPNSYNTVNCGATGDNKVQCGIQGSGASASPYCFNMTNLINDTYDPSSNTLSEKTYDGGSSAGFLVDCEATQGSKPYCRDTSRQGDFWCNQRDSCDTKNRKTECLAGKFAYESNSAECSTTCQNGYSACTDVNTTKSLSVDGPESCDVRIGQTEVGDGYNSSYASDSASPQPGNRNSGHRGAVFDGEGNSCGIGCPTQNGDPWIDVDNNLTNGCEVRQGASCTTNGVSGTINSDGVCVADKKNFTTGDFEEYDTTSSEDAMLWFRNADSDGDLINATNSIGESWRVNNNSCIVLKDNTTICDESDIGGNGSKWNLSGNYLYNNSGDLALNETELNNTIDSRSGGSGSSFWNLSSGILYPKDISYNVGLGTNSTSEKLAVNGTSNFLNNTIMNISQINTGNATINLTYYNSTAGSTVSYSTSGESSSNTSDFNKGEYRLTSASRNYNSGNLGIGYKNGTNSRYSPTYAQWRFDKYDPGNIKDYSTEKAFETSHFVNSYNKSADGVFSTNSYYFNSTGSHISANTTYSRNLSNYTISGWLYKPDWITGTNETWFSIERVGSQGATSPENLNLGYENGYLVAYKDGRSKRLVEYNIPSSYEGWVHYSLTYDINDDTFTLYINGEQEDNATEPDMGLRLDGGDARIGLGLNTSLISVSPTQKDFWGQGNGGRIDEITISDHLNQTEIRHQFFLGDPDQANVFVGFYNSSVIDYNNYSKNWTKIQINASIPSNTKANATFSAINSNGAIFDNNEVSINNGTFNYTADVDNSSKARIYFEGASNDPEKTWRINSYKVYSENNVTPPEPNTSTNPQYVFENSDVEINGLLNVTGSVTSAEDFCIQGGKCLSETGSGSGDITGVLTGNTPYLYNGSTSGSVSLNFNETYLNNTIDVSVNNSAFTSVTGDYLINNSGTLDFNETELNNAIDSRSSGGSGNSVWNLSGVRVYPENTNYNVSIGTNKTYGNRLQVNGSINASGNVTAENFVDSDGNVISGSSGGAVPSAVNLTSKKYDGKVVNGSSIGYEAADSICNAEYSGSHLCNEFEIMRAQSSGRTNLNNVDAWVRAGGPKYVPATNPVNDCGGFTVNTTGSSDPLGNYWHFNNSQGGEGRALNCGSKFKLACCSY